MNARRCGPGWLVTVVLVMILMASGRITAQTKDASKSVPAKVSEEDMEPGWEVASVRASNPSDTRGQHMNVRGRHVMLLDTTVEQFLLLGYGVQKSQLVGVPEWAKTVRWDVEGVPDFEGQPTLKQMLVLNRKILTERFGLRLHREQRELPVFTLTVAKGGPKMVVNTSDPNGWMDQQNSEDSTRHVEALTNASMAELALILQFHVDRPIVDRTGLEGRYDLKLQWAPQDASSGAADGPPGLFTAIQEQIGLKLDRVKAKADVLVIDTVEKPEPN